MLIGAQGARLLRDERSGGDSYWRKAAGGSPHAPWKASNLEWKSTTFEEQQCMRMQSLFKISKGHFLVTLTVL
jgi:hypothetical protein